VSFKYRRRTDYSWIGEFFAFFAGRGQTMVCGRVWRTIYVWRGQKTAGKGRGMFGKGMKKRRVSGMVIRSVKAGIRPLRNYMRLEVYLSPK
jgi:hypothetical protein